MDTKAGSLTNVEAGRRMRLSRARLAAADLERRGDCYAVAAVVWELTASYTKAWDKVYVEAIAELSGIEARNVRRAIKQLTKAGVIQWLPSYSRGRTGGSLVGLPSGAAENPLRADTTRSERADTTLLPGKAGTNQTAPKAVHHDDGGRTDEMGAEPKTTRACHKHPEVNWLVSGDKCPECEREKYHRERGSVS